MSDACRICGCTDEQACPGGCHWLLPGLCSQCVELFLVADEARTAVVDAAAAFHQAAVAGAAAGTVRAARAELYATLIRFERVRAELAGEVEARQVAV